MAHDKQVLSTTVRGTRTGNEIDYETVPGSCKFDRVELHARAPSSAITVAHAIKLDSRD